MRLGGWLKNERVVTKNASNPTGGKFRSHCAVDRSGRLKPQFRQLTTSSAVRYLQQLLDRIRHLELGDHTTRDSCPVNPAKKHVICRRQYDDCGE